MRDAFVDIVTAELEVNPQLAVVLAEISADRFERAAARHPDRVLNLGIREQLLVGAGGGLALSGLRPVVHTYAPFLVERPFEQIKLDFVHQDVGGVLVGIGGSFDGANLGRTHQAPGDVALIDSLPGWTVHVPGHPAEVEPLLRAALAGQDRVYLRLSTETNRDAHPGTGFQLIRTGRRGVVIAVGPVLDAVLDATATADVTVLYASTIRPFDTAGLCAALSGVDRADVVLVEPYLRGTSAHQANEALSEVPHRLLSLGVRRDEELRAYGTPAEHAAAHGLDARTIRAALDTFLG
nr:transketolase [Longimycelium tulufanense]